MIIRLGLELGLGLGLEQFLSLEQFVSLDPGIELGLTVFVTSRRYRQTNSAQALKETNRFTRLNADPCSYTRVSRGNDYVSFDTTIF